MKLTKIKDELSYKRDEDTTAVLNTNNEGLTLYRERRQQTTVIKKQVDEINKLKEDISEIKLLLAKIVKDK
tara:strand:+ start:664 stop:876 length:213 start_codon:yes stop_codon:yes gene_type:complete